MTNFPSRITIELTNTCNLNCKMCSRHHYPEMVEGYMSISLFEKIWREIKHQDVSVKPHTVFPFWRGESLLHDYFPCIIEKLERVSEFIVLATNGILVGYRKLPPHVLGLLDVVTVSIHGKASADGLKRLRTMRRAMLGPDRFFPKPKIVASRVIGESVKNVNWTEVENLCDDFRHYKEHTIDGKWGAIKWENIDNPHEGKLERKFCERLNTDLIIAWDGRVHRCCYVWNDPCLDGFNVNHDTIEDIWNSPEFNAIRDNYPDEICAGCDQYIGEGKTI